MKNIWIIFSSLLFTALAQAQTVPQPAATAAAMGALQVNGQAGKFQLFQKVKAVKCDTTKRGACEDPVFFKLNTAQAVPEGTYIVGFENSINPDLVRVTAGQTTQLNLVQVAVPSAVTGQKIRVFRDFSSAIEKNKILMSMYFMKRHFFRLDKANFGDLYLTGVWERDFVQRFSYNVCGKIKDFNATDEAKEICNSVNKAQSPANLAALYSFAEDGTFIENWVTEPGDVIPSKHPRYLVSAPMTAQDFVAVFPGAYKVQAEGKNMPAVSVKTGGLY